MKGWIGVGLDGTLAHHKLWRGPQHIGHPIPEMVDRVRKWIADGENIKIFTARCDTPHQLPVVIEWLERHGLGGLEITNVKDYGMIELWDDRAVRVIKNTGRKCCDK